MRVVLDTNIFISSLLGGRLAQIVDRWRSGDFILVVTAGIAREYLDVINRPKFKIPENEIAQTVDFLFENAEFITSEEEINVITTDVTDNKFLEAALEGKADLIVSGDTHLLDLKMFRDIPVITAREFISRLESQ